MGMGIMGATRPISAEGPEFHEQRAHTFALVVLRNLKTDLFSWYPDLGVDRIHAVIEDAARDA